MMPNPIYLDHAATTPLDERVREVMSRYLSTEYGNPSSIHRLGRRARHVVEECRERVADLIGAEASEIVFTSGGSEADNLALRGIPGPLVTSAAEHEAVLRTAEAERATGRPVAVIDPEHEATVSAEWIRPHLSAETRLVSVMHVNNETGAISPVADIGALCRAQGILFHSDAVQSLGILAVTVDELNVDLLSASAHKFYGPKGIGFLYVRRGVELQPQVTGGSQERGRRAGTENVAAVVGLTEALRLARQEQAERFRHAAQLHARFHDGLASSLPGSFQVNTPAAADRRIPHIINISFPPEDDQLVDGEMLLLNLDMEGVMASAGSACTSGALEPSHVLRAMGIPDATARASVRFSFGKGNTVDEVDRAVDVLSRTIARMRRTPAV